MGYNGYMVVESNRAAEVMIMLIKVVTYVADSAAIIWG
jgi:hypothetical protein